MRFVFNMFLVPFLILWVVANRLPDTPVVWGEFLLALILIIVYTLFMSTGRSKG